WGGLAAGGADDPGLLEEEVALARRAGEDCLEFFVDHARSSFRNHRTVCVRPSSSDVRALHPSRVWARVALSTLRRCSPGLAGACSAARPTPVRRARRR